MKANHLILLCALLVAGCSKDSPSVSAGGSSSGSTTGSTPPKHIDSIQRTYHLDDLTSVTLVANGHNIHAWVMDDEGKRREGMMFLTDKDVNQDDGMIFAFPE